LFPLVVFLSLDTTRELKNRAGFDKGTCWSTTSFIEDIEKFTEKIISEVHEKRLGEVLISIALSFMASSSTFFHSGRGSN
jgi:hypothetical protein